MKRLFFIDAKNPGLDIIKNKILAGVQLVKAPRPDIHQAIGNIKRNKIAIAFMINITNQAELSHSFHGKQPFPNETGRGFLKTKYLVAAS